MKSEEERGNTLREKEKESECVCDKYRQINRQIDGQIRKREREEVKLDGCQTDVPQNEDDKGEVE